MSRSKLLVVEDDEMLRDALRDTLALAGYDVMESDNGRSALHQIAGVESEIAAVISDIQMQPMNGHQFLKHVKAQYPDLPVLLMTAYGNIEKAVQAMRDGASDYLVKPFEAEVLVNKVSQYALSGCSEDNYMIAVDESSRQFEKLARRVANSDATVLITGESGVGKEVIARYIHQQSPRSNHAFVAINCAAIPDNMLEATLFGYEKGAFTGAYQACPGKFEQANGGTLLLDEISEMSLGLQAKLLRVLQEREVERLGGRKMIPLDIRILATSNRHLRDEVANKRFREDLYYRLNVFPIHISPLRNRPADVIPLAERCLQKRARSTRNTSPVLSDEAKQCLLRHAWPGNVRELDNVLQRALILCNGDEVLVDDIRFENIAANSGNLDEPTDSITVDDDLDENLKTHEQKLIIDALQAGFGNRKFAADRLGISPRTLRYKLARMREAGIAIPGR